MNVTIIGAGNMGLGIGTRVVAGGHNVTFVDQNMEVANKAAVTVLKSAKNDAKTNSASLGNVELGDVVVLAVWYGTNINLVKELGTRLSGKVVVDIANPMNSTYDGLATAADSSSAEEVARATAAGVSVVKAFNTTFAGTLIAGQVAGQPLDVFLAGDDDVAKEKVARLIVDGGMRPVDIGKLAFARQIEGMQLLHIVAQSRLEMNWGSTLKILS